MADLSLPTGCTITVANVADAWNEHVGSAPDTSASSPGEQSKYRGIHDAWFEGLGRLAEYGYSDADALLILAGSLLSGLIDGALCHALHDDIELDASRAQVAVFFCNRWQEALARHALVGHGADATKYYPDPSTATAAARLQARETVRNGPDGNNHDHEIDWFYGQFHGRAPLLERYAGRRYGNRRGGAA